MKFKNSIFGEKKIIPEEFYVLQILLLLIISNKATQSHNSYYPLTIDLFFI